MTGFTRSLAVGGGIPPLTDHRGQRRHGAGGIEEPLRGGALDLEVDLAAAKAVSWAYKAF